jgi:hypothetical protein
MQKISIIFNKFYDLINDFYFDINNLANNLFLKIYFKDN